MAIPSFFKQNKPRGFNYVPRYYDPAKEEREEKLRAWRREHPAESGQGEQEAEARKQGAQGRRQGAENGGQSTAADSHEGQNQPYRSRIVRGDMKNYFHRSKERVDRHTTIRLIVIILIIVLVVYLYLHF